MDVVYGRVYEHYGTDLRVISIMWLGMVIGLDSGMIVGVMIMH
jgi:hypothetical protein